MIYSGTLSSSQSENAIDQFLTEASGPSGTLVMCCVAVPHASAVCICRLSFVLLCQWEALHTGPVHEQWCEKHKATAARPLCLEPICLSIGTCQPSVLLTVLGRCGHT